jgi:hypothetical protein
MGIADAFAACLTNTTNQRLNLFAIPLRPLRLCGEKFRLDASASLLTS